MVVAEREGCRVVSHDISIEFFRLREGAVLGKFRRIFSYLGGAGIVGVKFRLGGDAELKEFLLEDADRVACGTPLVFFLSSAIVSRVGHGVPTEAIGFDFQQIGAIAAPSMFGGPLHGFVDGNDIHTIYLLTGHVVSGGAWEQLVNRPGFMYGHAQRVLVVLTNIYIVQLPDGRKVQRFVERSLVNRAIAKETEGDIVLPQVLVGQGDTRRNR